MKKLGFGETAVLANNEEYTCFANLVKDGEDYVFLMSHAEPSVVKIAKQKIINGELGLSIVKDEKIKKELLKIYKDHFASSVESLVQ